MNFTNSGMPSMSCTSTLVIVHPGSCYGSADMHLGKYEARAARDGMLMEISQHTGGLIIIDGFLSDEIPTSDENIFQVALERAEAAGHIALRVWGCDAGEAPFLDWSPTGLQGSDAVFLDQEAAIENVSHRIEGGEVFVGGAWARSDAVSGCATSVLQKLLQTRPDLRVSFSDYAIFEADDPRYVFE